MTLSATELTSALREDFGQTFDFSDDEMWTHYRWLSGVPFVVPGVDGTVEVVDSEGGNEGDGEHMHLVFKVIMTDGDVLFFKINGYYASWDGASWDGSELYPVVPREKMVTVYE